MERVLSSIRVPPRQAADFSHQGPGRAWHGQCGRGEDAHRRPLAQQAADESARWVCLSLLSLHLSSPKRLSVYFGHKKSDKTLLFLVAEKGESVRLYVLMSECTYVCMTDLSLCVPKTEKDRQKKGISGGEGGGLDYPRGNSLELRTRSSSAHTHERTPSRGHFWANGTRTAEVTLGLTRCVHAVRLAAYSMLHTVCNSLGREGMKRCAVRSLLKVSCVEAPEARPPCAYQHSTHSRCC